MTENGNFRAFVWTPGQGYAILGTLGGASSYAMAVNNEGLIAGSAQTPGGYSHAFISNGVTMQDLGTLGGFASYAYGINDAGNIVGDSWTAGNASADGFLVEGGVMYDINALLIDDPGWTVTALYAINDSNQIVGVGLLNGVEHAVLLTDPPAPDSLTTTAAVSEPVEWVLTAAGLAMLVLRRRITPSASPPPPLQPRLPPGHRR
jgi:probable HAF family extracellular repeat protein